MVKRPHRNILAVKLRRDMFRAAMQFLSIIVLCALGTFAFSALDGTARMTRVTVNTYFEENHLADFWVTMPNVDRSVLTRISRIPGVEDLCARYTEDYDAENLGDHVQVNVTAYDGPMSINIPLLRSGTLLSESDTRGCLIEERFALAHGMKVGDRITIKKSSTRYSFVIRGIVVSPEYIVVTNHVAADAKKYGYILLNHSAIGTLPLNQAVLRIAPYADADAVRDAIKCLYPESLVRDRNGHSSTSRINNNADMFENMTLIFPLLAYFIAALIVMTTLERMIENQRMQMGTLRALGFSARHIRRHYLSYAILPSLIGALIGMLVGHYTLPQILWNSLIGQNEMPYQLHPPISLPSWGMVLLTVIMSMGICTYSYRKASRETAASLLRPKPPKSGHRILLERITPLWKRLSFNSKMIVRNIMRNKMRSFMTSLGMLFCTMLIITSFGLQDSVKTLAYDYYQKSIRYDLEVRLTGDVGTAESYDRRLPADRVECIMVKSATLQFNNQQRTINFTVMEDDQQLHWLGPNYTWLRMTTGSVGITRKLSRILGINVGDTVEIQLPGETRPVLLPVGHIVENNFSQGVYLNQSTWKTLRKGAFVPTSICLSKPTDYCLKLISDMQEVDRLFYPAESIVQTLNMLETLSSVFGMLTGIALTLAFVICYNMGLMNFVERTREYATLKVMGYHQKEIRRVITLENLILSLIGILCGIWPGILLTDVIMHSCEPETANYSGTPALQSILIACLLTFFFSVLLQLLLTRKVRRINMVEALKSVE